MRGARVVTGAVLALGAATAVAVAQQPAPTIGVDAGPAAVTVQAPGPLPAGPTRFEVTRAGDRPLSVYFFLLNTGVSQQEFEAALNADDRRGGDSALGLVSIQASVALDPGVSRRGVTFALKPGLTYHVLSEADPDTPAGPRQRGITSFTTSGEPNGATSPTPSATVQMVGLRFRGDRVLPRNGIVRVVNGDGVPHFAIAFPLRPRVTSRQLGRALRSNSDRVVRRTVAGPPYSLQSLMSGGNTVNDQEVAFPRAGRYGLVCFFGEHHVLGMYRVVTVR